MSGVRMVIGPMPPSGWTAMVVAGLLATGCVSGNYTPRELPLPATVPGSSPETAASVEGRQVEGLYDVGGHKLFMRCEGNGSPTVVYLHGWIDKAGILPHVNGEYIAERLPDHRVCLYDRRNVGRSQTVNAVQTPADALHDMERVLAVGRAQPPYVLMAASYGGLLAYSYLNHHPDHVVGMVLLDAMFPDELELDRYLHHGDRFIDYQKEDGCCSLERTPQYDMVRDLQQYIGKEPPVPVIYLAAKQEPRNLNNYHAPEYDRRVIPALEDYVNRFSPGKLRWLDSPHFMEPAVPGEVADAIREITTMAKKT